MRRPCRAQAQRSCASTWITVPVRGRGPEYSRVSATGSQRRSVQRQRSGQTPLCPKRSGAGRTVSRPAQHRQLASERHRRFSVDARGPWLTRGLPCGWVVGHRPEPHPSLPRKGRHSRACSACPDPADGPLTDQMTRKLSAPSVVPGATRAKARRAAPPRPSASK